MHPTSVDRDGFLRNLRASKLLTSEQFRQVIESTRKVRDARKIVKTLVNEKLITKFQACMLLKGRNGGFFLGPYRILDKVGQGGMGRVYKAIHETMNRVVALKVLAPQIVSNERARLLFLHEVQAAAKLNHPNIVMAFDANEIDRRHYLAMEYVDGANLERYVKDRGPLPVGLACEIIFQTANGLQHALEKGMVHRDIKPANLLLQHDVDSRTLQIKVLDFGLARLQSRDKSVPEKTLPTRENIIMGTPDFLSPEQSRDLHEVDIRADLYSLGCTFYFLLTGLVPFAGGKILDKLARHNSEVARPIEEIRSDVPPKVANIVRKLMAKAPEDRHQTPYELMDALALYAAPMNAEWPFATMRAAALDRSDEQVLLPEPQGDTEPRAQGSTEVTDAESILEWAGTQSKQRRGLRRVVITAVVIGVGLLALAAAAGLAL